tara:strand:- start:1848 stop:2099 length:252 start_codon:yes stop_codon:yes gene_type:complete
VQAVEEGIRGMDTTTVWVLWHSYDLDGKDESKLIGVYSSVKLANDARDRMIELPGFREHPQDFVIDRYVLNEDHWREGFVTFR